MLKSIFIVFISILFAASSSGQNIITVSSNPVIPAQYSNLQTAINAAADGAIIYLHPAETAYGGTVGILLDKDVSIIGGGMYNDANGRFNRLESVIGKLTITGRADNLKIANCSINRVFMQSQSAADVVYENVLFEYNYLGRVDFHPFEGNIGAVAMEMRNNIIGNLNFNDWINFGDAFELMVQNNLLALVSNGGGKEVIFRNNLFNPKSISNVCLEEVSGSTFLNNIFYGVGQTASMGINNANSCIFDYNLSFETIDSFNGGQSNSFGGNNLPDTDPLFTTINNNFLLINQIFASDFTLQEGSPAIGAGAGNTDIGITGGEWPFFHKQPYAFPLITELQVSNPVLNQDETLRFTIKAENP